MAHGDGFWKLEHLSNAQLLESLGGVLRAQRRGLAELVAHLGEVEERRLHLEAAYSSMFAYCVARLGMSEDEACRRIELARLARRFPALFAELASGRITLSVALVLKPVLSPSNHVELLAAVRGKCLRQARELVAERFPKADAPSSVRKLPERRQEPSPLLTPATRERSLTLPSAATSVVAAPSSASGSPLTSPAGTPAQRLIPDLAMPALTATSAARPRPAHSTSAVEQQLFSPVPCPASTAASRSCIEPLSAQRYRIQFTADADLKRKLELARGLLRHAHPNGDFGPIFSRALDLLIEDLLRRRFGAGARRKAPRAGSASAAQASPSDTSLSASTVHAPAAAAGVSRASASPTVTPRAPTARAPHVSRSARRIVLERDGLGCSWVDAQGLRCGSQAWLEIDHRQPAGKDGSSEPDNLRLLCRAHNRLAAEHEYGRAHIERMLLRHRGIRRKEPRSPT